MRFIPLSQIMVEKRMRSRMDERKLEELRDSILENGLIHPLIVAPRGDGTYRLVCGGRRLEALKRLPPGEPIRFADGTFMPSEPPCIVLGEDLTEHELALLEFEENERRSDLDWRDRVLALKRIAELAGTLTEAAEIVSDHSGMTEGGARTLLSKGLTIAEHLDDPSVQKAKSFQAAYRAAKRLAEAKTAEALNVISAAPQVALIEGDALEILPRLPRGAFRAIVWDPPYGIGADKWRRSTIHHYKDDPEIALSLIRETATLLRPLLAEGGHLWLFFDIRNLQPILEILSSLNLKIRSHPLIWHKPGHEAAATDQLAAPIKRTYEMILFASDPSPARASHSYLDDVLSIPPEDPDLRSLHKAAKPVELMKRLLSFSCVEGDRVLDPMCGLGASLEAAHLLGLRALGIEADAATAKLAVSKRSGITPINLDELEDLFQC